MADNPFQLAAALAYYTIFFLAPLLLLVIAIAGLVVGQEATERQSFRTRARDCSSGGLGPHSQIEIRPIRRGVKRGSDLRDARVHEFPAEFSDAGSLGQVVREVRQMELGVGEEQPVLRAGLLVDEGKFTVHHINMVRSHDCL